jgi:hypothetical protein
LTDLPKWSRAARDALDRSTEELGFDLSEVLDDEDWSVMWIDGRAETVVTTTGVRKLAVFSPDQDRASQVVDAVNQHLEDLENRG